MAFHFTADFISPHVEKINVTDCELESWIEISVFNLHVFSFFKFCHVSLLLSCNLTYFTGRPLLLTTMHAFQYFVQESITKALKLTGGHESSSVSWTHCGLDDSHAAVVLLDQDLGQALARHHFDRVWSVVADNHVNLISVI
jgi:hypothetical protein